MDINKHVFDPAMLSFADCEFLLAHAGEPPIVALRSLPAMANRVTMEQWVARLYELEEQRKRVGIEWAGLEAVKASIKVYLDQRAKWAKDVEMGAPKFPSLYAFDARGKGHLSGTGSDSGRVKSYFDEKGQRHEFAVSLTDGTAQGVWKPEWAVERPATETMKLTEGVNTILCGVPGCGHVETFKVESRSSYGAARARISKHLRKSESEKEAHLELHTLEFGS